MLNACLPTWFFLPADDGIEYVATENKNVHQTALKSKEQQPLPENQTKSDKKNWPHTRILTF